MNRAQLMAQRAELLAQLQALHTRNQDLTAEEQTTWTNLTAQVRTIDTKLQRLDEFDAITASTPPTIPTPDTRATDPPAPTPTPDARTPEQRATENERQRIADITTLCREMGADAAPHIASGATLETATRAIIAQRAAGNPPSRTAGRAQVGEENVDKFRLQASDALILRAGLDITLAQRGGGYKPADGADQLRHMGLIDLMREYCTLRGVQNANRLSIDELRREVYGQPDSQYAAMIDNTVGKSLLIGYSDANITFDQWTTPESNPDFKPTRKYRLSEASTPQQILQGGEFKYDAMSDQRVQFQLETFGIMWTLTRQAIINDDLGYITMMPAAYVRAYRRLINRTVYGILNGNAKFQVDNQNLFYSAHGNLATAAAHPTTAAIGLARAAMRKQTNIRGDEKLNLAPKFILCGPDLETPIQRLLISVADPDSTNAGVVNPFQRAFTHICDAELTSATGTPTAYPDWFLACSQSDRASIAVSYLNGNAQPYAESQIGHEYLGQCWRLYGDFDVDILDYRGLYKTPGAAAA